MTAIVAVMKIFGIKIVNSWNSNSGKMEIKPKIWLNLNKKHLNQSKSHHKGFGKPNNNASKGIIVKTTIRVLLDTGSSDDLLFIKKRFPQIYTMCEEECTTVMGHFQWHLSN